uniref:Retinol dehydrogenase 11 n=1 Tax=Photinus pyralis TaxID=7054 RepID=A0A1Y1MK23_PHOPY
MGFFHAMCNSDARLDTKTVIVTGSNAGIGKCTVEDFYKRGARVIMACRNRSKAEKSRDDIIQNCHDAGKNLGEIAIVELDLTSFRSIKECAKKLAAEEQRINILVNNAGIMFNPEGRTEDGYELQFGTNYLGHYLFTLLLLPKLIESAPARILNVSSFVHMLHWGRLTLDDLNWKKRRYNPTQSYYQSKVCNILFTKELARRLKDANFEGVTVYSLHPGIINTELTQHFDSAYFSGFRWLFSNIGGLFFKSATQGAQTTIHCAVDENAGKENGLYYAECAPKKPSWQANNMEDAKSLWDISWKMVDLPDDYNIFRVAEDVQT